MSADTQLAPPATGHSSRLKGNQLGTTQIVFLVMAAVAPLTAMIVVASIGMALGNGGGMVASFIAVMLVMICFATGYGQMSSSVVNAGGFYAYTVRALGRQAGMASGLIALLGYNGFVIGAFGTTGFYFQTIVASLTGIDIHWMIWAVVLGVIAFLFTRQGIQFSTKILSISLVLEMAILLVLDVKILATTGFTIHAFDPSVITSGSVGLGLLFAANAFVGFEATSLFSEEARDPHRTIKRATFAAILTIGLFAAFTTWAFVSALGASSTQSIAAEHLAAGDLVFTISTHYLGSAFTTVMQLLLLVSLFAALLALHNSATRYLYALGRARALPSWLSHTRPDNGAPVHASATQVVLSLAVLMIFVVAGAQPMTSVVPAMTGFGTLAIIALQLIAAVAIIVFFRRRHDTRLLTTLVIPGIGTVGLAVILTLAIANFGVMAGSNSPVVAALPWLLPIVAVAGVIYALFLKARRPAVYLALDDDIEALA